MEEKRTKIETDMKEIILTPSATLEYDEEFERWVKFFGFTEDAENISKIIIESPRISYVRKQEII